MTYAILKYVYSVGLSLSSQRTQGDIFWHRGQRELGITRQEIQDLLRNPKQIVHGDLGAFIAQARRKNGLLRAPFVDVSGNRKILTVYWTSKIEKYWED
jgi:hypothetical protein